MTARKLPHSSPVDLAIHGVHLTEPLAQVVVQNIGAAEGVSLAVAAHFVHRGGLVRVVLRGGLARIVLHLLVLRGGPDHARALTPRLFYRCTFFAFTAFSSLYLYSSLMVLHGRGGCKPNQESNEALGVRYNALEVVSRIVLSTRSN